VSRPAAAPWAAAGPGRERTRSSLTGGLHLEVHEDSQVGAARRAVATLARQLDLSPEDAGAASLAVTELATNLVRHGGGGEISLWPSPDADGEPTIELAVMDRGPGMADVARSFVDGYSTTGTAGTGLGSVRRAARQIDAWSHPRRGTVLWLRIGGRRPAAAVPGRFELGALTTPKPGQECFGDAWAAVERDGVLTALVVDGVGHGPQAAEASRLAVGWFVDHPGEAPEATMAAFHEALRGSRGAVAGVARIDPAAGTLRWAGVGNVAGLLAAPGEKERRFVSHGGTLGYSADHIQPFDHPCPPGSLVVLCSDGVATSWSLDGEPGLAAHHPAVVAGVLHRDHRRGRDDATVLVVRVRGGAGGGVGAGRRDPAADGDEAVEKGPQ
jgi:anti-sigma regulatory factor (Ser/Thr protein kinase)